MILGPTRDGGKGTPRRGNRLAASNRTPPERDRNQVPARSRSTEGVGCRREPGPLGQGTRVDAGRSERETHRWGLSVGRVGGRVEPEPRTRPRIGRTQGAGSRPRVRERTRLRPGRRRRPGSGLWRPVDRRCSRKEPSTSRGEAPKAISTTRMSSTSGSSPSTTDSRTFRSGWIERARISRNETRNPGPPNRRR